VRVGLLGGTFDPVHLGHLRAAELAREALGLEQVLFVPAGRPPHRSDGVSAPHHRYAMVALAVEDQGAFVSSDMELRREGPSYTVDTLEALHDERPGDEIVLVVGADTLPELGSWRSAERIMALCSVAVVPREGAARGSGGAAAGGRVRLLPEAGLPIAATALRQRVREGRSIRYLVPGGVADYIAKAGLYR
jgi:nicotinate-nucleotide adenylyltransferase